MRCSAPGPPPTASVCLRDRHSSAPPPFPDRFILGEARPMTTIFHSQNPRSLRVLWVLEEMGVKAEVKLLPFPPRRLQPEYLALNPSGTVSLMIEGERVNDATPAGRHVLPHPARSTTSRAIYALCTPAAPQHN